MRYVPVTAAAGDWDPSNEVPVFDRVWQYYVEIDDQWREDHVVEAWLDRLEDPSDYYGYATEEIVEIAEDLEGDYADPDVLLRAALLVYLEQEARSEYEENYWNAVYAVEHHDGDECWRVVTLPSTADPTTLDPVGRFWSYEEPVCGGGQADFCRWEGQVRYRGRIDDSNIDKEYTVLLNTEPGRVEWEAEVRMLAGRRIWVYDVELADGTVIPINDWRSTDDPRYEEAS